MSSATSCVPCLIFSIQPPNFMALRSLASSSDALGSGPVAGDRVISKTLPSMTAAVAPPVRPPRLRPWHRASDESAGSFHVFEVRRVQLVDADGRDRGHAFTTRCNDWCNVIAVTPADEIVLVWQYRFGTGRFSLEIPGGVIDA